MLLIFNHGCAADGIDLDKEEPGTKDHTGETSETGDSEDTDTGDSEDTDTGTEPVENPPDWVVDCRGGADFEEIQPAIEAASSGDRIGVEPCEYRERLDFLGKSIEVYGIEGSSRTTLDAFGDGTAVNIENHEGGGTRFAGFTVTDGTDSTNGGGLEVYFGAVEVEDVVFEDMGTSLYIIESYDGFVDLIDVVIDGTGLLDGGSAILAESGGLTMRGSQIDCGAADNGLYHHVSANITESSIRCDGGYGVQNYHGEMVIQRSTITGGEAGVYTYDTESTPEEPDSPNEIVWIFNSAIGGGVYGLQAAYQNLSIENSVFWGDEAAFSFTEGNSSTTVTASAFLMGNCGISSDTSMSLRYSAFWGNGTDVCGIAANPTVTDDPRFVDFPDDLHLEPDSPLVDAGPSGDEWADEDGSPNDIGVYGGPHPLDW